MGFAHRTLSTQTAQIENAASDLFRRCEQLREELSNQVKQMSELSSRMQRLGNDDEDDEHVEKEFERRLLNARDRQQSLSERHEALRRKIARAGTAGRDLSAKEMSWAQEIRRLAKNVGVESEDDDPEQRPAGGKILDERFDTVCFLRKYNIRNQNTNTMYQVKQLAAQLLQQTKNVQKDTSDTDTIARTYGHARSSSTASKRSSIANPNVLVSTKLQKAKITEAMTMVEREGAVIEAVMARLKRLNVDP